MQSAQASNQHKIQEFEHRVDYSHIWVTPYEPPKGKLYAVLGELSYRDSVNADSISEANITERLKKLAFARWPDSIDAIINEKQVISADGTQILVTGTAIKYE